MAANLRTRPARLIPWLLVVAFACTNAPTQEPPEGDDVATDAAGLDSIVFRGSDTGAQADVAAATGELWLTIEVDDTANKTFSDEEIKWTGSFAWDDKSNTIVYADSWLPSDGPYPYLWDDGPLSAGGHEREGATKGDHIFSTAVKFVAVEDTTLQYGMLNEFDNWMWIGANGVLEVKKGATGVVAAKGMVLTAHGDVDMKVTLDTSKVHEKFATWGQKPHKFYVKGTMNMWTPRQLLDDGNKGDEAADDGIYTYVHSSGLGAHDGLLNSGEEVQFVWVATQGDTAPAAGKEYKSGVNAHMEGVSAWTNTGPANAWVPVPVALALDSKGKVKNTAIVVPAASGGCDPACKADEVCEGGKCVPNVTEPCGGLCTPKQKCVDDKCVDSLWLDKLMPANGALLGGTKVDVLGGGFKAAATVRFGGKTATCTFKDAGTLQCSTPAAGKSGAVAVEVEQGIDKVSKDAAFTYDSAPDAQVLLLDPVAISASEGEAIKGLMGRVRVAGITTDPGQNKDVTVEFGLGPAGSTPANKSWKWVSGVFVEEDQFGKGEETYSADFPGQALGDHLFTVRATHAGKTVVGDSDGSENGLSLTKLGTIKVTTKDTTPKVTGLEPAWASAKGGSTVIVLGNNLTKGFKVEIKSSVFPIAADALDVAEVAKGLSFKLPIGPGPMPTWPPKPASVIVTPTGAPALTLDKALHLVPIHTPTIDGKVTIDEWSTATQLGVNNATSGWANNSVTLSYAAYDKDNLYIGVESDCEPLNGIVVYVDVDYGAKTGVQNPSELKDNDNSDNSVDDVLSSVLKVSDGGFGIDFGFATLGMKSFFGKTLADSKEAGWRGMKNPANFDWVLGQVVAQSGSGVEASIPLATLFPNGVPAKGTEVAFFAAVVNKTGGQVAPGAISPNTTNVSYGEQVKQLASFHVFPL